MQFLPRLCSRLTRDTCTPFVLKFSLRMCNALKRSAILKTNKPFFFFLKVGYRPSVRLWTRSLGRSRRAAETTLVELFSPPGPIGNAIIRSPGARQTALFGAELHGTLPLSARQYVRISGMYLLVQPKTCLHRPLLQRLDIRGRVKILHGQNRKTEEPPLALFAYCTPFGPPSLLEIPQKENMFKSKHKLDLSLVSMDQRWENFSVCR